MTFISNLSCLYACSGITAIFYAKPREIESSSFAISGMRRGVSSLGVYVLAFFSYLYKVKKSKSFLLDFEIDGLTNSILNTVSGESFATEISLLIKADLKQVTKSKGWLFNWREELKSIDREVYKLTIVNNPTIIQGTLSLTVNADHVFIHLIENAPFNRHKNKIYEGVPGNLIAFACKTSFQRGGAGFVSFRAKTKLIDHYIETLGAYHFANQLMVIDTDGANKLVEKYFKN